jgi:hypothetical protein
MYSNFLKLFRATLVIERLCMYLFCLLPHHKLPLLRPSVGHRLTADPKHHNARIADPTSTSRRSHPPTNHGPQNHDLAASIYQPRGHLTVPPPPPTSPIGAIPVAKNDATKRHPTPRCLLLMRGGSVTQGTLYRFRSLLNKRVLSSSHIECDACDLCQGGVKRTVREKVKARKSKGVTRKAAGFSGCSKRVWWWPLADCLQLSSEAPRRSGAAKVTPVNRGCRKFN